MENFTDIKGENHKVEKTATLQNGETAYLSSGLVYVKNEKGKFVNKENLSHDNLGYGVFLGVDKLIEEAEVIFGIQ